MKNEDKNLYFEQIIKNPHGTETPKEINDQIEICEFLVEKTEEKDVKSVTEFLVRLDNFFFVVWTMKKLYSKFGKITITKAWIDFYKKNVVDRGEKRILEISTLHLNLTGAYNAFLKENTK